MQWLILVFWSLRMAICRHSRRFSLLRAGMALGLACAMALQLVLLHLDGMLTLETALPLHLCGLFGVLSIPLLFYPKGPLWEASAFLGAPAAACALVYPAVIPCSHPLLMRAAFIQLHALVALVPCAVLLTGKPLPVRPRRTLLFGSGYLLAISWFNHAFGTNYLFLRAAPSGTPLEWFLSRGTAFYVCSLLIICMVVFSCLQGLYCRINERFSPLTAGNSSAYSRYGHCTPPCTSRDQG